MAKQQRAEMKEIAKQTMGDRHYHIEWHAAGRTVRPFAVVVPHDGGVPVQYALVNGVWTVWA